MEVRDQIITEIRRLAAANGGQAPGSRGFERETGIRNADWRGVHWARWSDALAEAGCAPNAYQGKSDSRVILEKFIEAARHYRHLPTAMELRMYRKAHADFPNEKTVHSHFGSKELLLSNLRTWVQGKDNLEDIVQMLKVHGASEIRHPPERVSGEGLVYLIKSAAHYKIGHSDDLERRVKEIRIALPEAATLVHCIRTDDPSGIEAYWHRRFADRRANGEWFRLSSADVAAFRRRRYQ